MKSFKSIVQVGGIALVLLLLTSCGVKNDVADDTGRNSNAASSMTSKHDTASTLPKQYQRPAYMVGDELVDSPVSTKGDDEDVQLKVGATIRSTTGPQPLWTVMKWLAELKNMNVSWASDVDSKVLVDVDINANDDFYSAIDNLLRQVDYYHEMQGNTIVVKYKETRRYQLGMPFTKHKFSTGTGGNVLGGNDTANNLEGTISLESKDNEYDFWQTVDDNLNKILNVWKTEEVADASADADSTTDSNDKNKKDNKKDSKKSSDSDKEVADKDKKTVVHPVGTRRLSGNDNMYTIDRSIGLITVTAPRPMLEKVDDYVNSLKKYIYRQINIEAKIIEVQLTSETQLGIDWSDVLSGLTLTGTINFGSDGQIWPYVYGSDTSGTTSSDDGTSYTKSYDPGRFVSSVTLDSADYTAVLHALNEEGQTTVLSNPKISLLNGQAALITVGQNQTYVSEVTVDVDDDTGDKTYSVDTDDILSGLGMALTATIVNDDEVIMNLTPVVSDLYQMNDYEVGDDGGQVQLPIVNIREMSTTVRVKTGETLIIGGLIDETKENTSSFLPVLGDIPIVKYLFGYEDKTKDRKELVIMLKPVIL